ARTTDVQPIVLQKLTVRTDEKGEAAFAFRLPRVLAGRESDGGDARFTLQATVTDSAGQKQSKNVARVVTTQALRIEVIPEAGPLVRGVPNTICRFTSHPDGRPAKAEVSLFAAGVQRKVRTNSLGIAWVEVTPDTTTVGLTLEARDAEGHVGRRHDQLTCGSPFEDFLVRTDKAVYDGGATVHLVALGTGKEPVFVDFIKDGQTFLTTTLNLTDGRGEHQLDLPPELFGSVELCAYRFNATGLPAKKTRVLYIRPAGQLRIKTTLDHTEYRPGGQARVQLALTDTQGQPVPGALSVAAVDEAVFAVLDQAPGMEKIFYTLEQQRMKPVYAIYPWSPDLTTSVNDQERDRFEQALFARTAFSDDGLTPKSALAKPAQSLHTLFAGSFPSKEQQVHAAREKGLYWVEKGWLGLGIGV